MIDENSERLVRMETKLDIVIGLNTDHEQRLRKLEERKWPLPSIAALLAAAGLALGIWNSMGG